MTISILFTSTIIIAGIIFYLVKHKKTNYTLLNILQLEQLIEEQDIVLVDSRGKYFSSICKIESAICIPDIEFHEYCHLLPKDKSTPIVFYCRDKNCKLSAKSAIKSIKMGYQFTYVFTEGIEGWNKHKGIVIEEDTSLNGRSIDKVQFKPFYRANKESIQLIDVNDKEVYNEGHLKNAVPIPLGEIPGSYLKLPQDKILIFYCATGIKSEEAVSFLLDKSTIDIQNLFYLKASVSFDDTGNVIFEDQDK